MVQRRYEKAPVQEVLVVLGHFELLFVEGRVVLWRLDHIDFSD